MKLLSMLGPLRTSLLRWIFGNDGRNYIGFDKYRNKGAFHWEELERNPDYRRKIEAVQEYIQPRHLCLDLGCGDGAYMYAISGRCRNVLGIDADFDAIRLAKLKFKEHRVRNCTCMQAAVGTVTAAKIAVGLSLLSPRFLLRFLSRGGRFDVVYAMDVVEHLPDPHELMRVAARAARRGGLVVIGTPLLVKEELVSPYHVKEFTLEEIRGLVSSYLEVREEVIQPMRRKDGNVYEQGFYISLGRPRR